MLATRPKPARTKPLRDLVTGKVLPSLKMTEEEFVAWSEEKTRAEWVDGEVVLMSPVTVDHDDLMTFLVAIMRFIAEESDLGRVFGSEVELRLATQKRRRLPDIKFVRKERLAILRPNGIEGAPDLIVEIVSPDSVSRDYRDKFDEYARAGVREYWIVDPLANRLEAHALHAKTYRAIPEIDGWIMSTVLKKFGVKPAALWQRPLPTLHKALKDLGVKL